MPLRFLLLLGSAKELLTDHRFLSRIRRDSVIMSASALSNGDPLNKKLLAATNGNNSERALRLVLFLALGAIFSAPNFAQTSPAPFPGAEPSDVDARWKPWIGHYAGDLRPPPAIRWIYVVAETHGEIQILQAAGRGEEVHYKLLERVQQNAKPSASGFVLAHKDKHELLFGDVISNQLIPGLEDDQLTQTKPTRSVEELRVEALAATPPDETGTFRKSDLIELVPLDPAIHLDIRYATSNDFLGTPVYTQARAFLQRPAAEALLRALHKLQPLGYGLLIHDGYRPWYVTKIFWDATPPEGKIFVADPAQGSRHNRGCAVDLTLYDLKSGKPIEMTGAYDEMSPRSFPNYPGGTSLQRWHRDLLRWAMESEGFTVYEAEWWHFDYKDWHEYAIGNTPFEKLNVGPN